MVRKNLEFEWRVVLSALYLAGAPHGLHLDRRRWPAVLGALRGLGLAASEAEAGLRAKGLFAEAAALSAGGGLDWAQAAVENGRVLTCLCDGYPERWLAVLGDQAPPVGWAGGDGGGEQGSGGAEEIGDREARNGVHGKIGSPPSRQGSHLTLPSAPSLPCSPPPSRLTLQRSHLPLSSAPDLPCSSPSSRLSNHPTQRPSDSALPCLGIVGSRDVEPLVHRFCAEAARVAVDLGYRVVSGGAAGCDRAALEAAARHGGQSLCLLPYGIELADREIPPGQDRLSFCEPREPFSRGRAMERNALIYASGRVTVVGQVRFREGGTWHGATAALRRSGQRGSTRLLVRRPGPYEPEEIVRGARALVALGAAYLDDPAQMEDHLTGSAPDHGLFAGLKAG